jgi:hypothetical protein
MKKPTNATQPLLAAFLASAALCSASPSLWASEPGTGADPTAAEPQTATEAESAATPETAAAPATGLPSPQEVVSRLQAKLSLSAEQASALTPIIASRQEKLKALMAQSGGRPLKKRREMRDIVSDSDKQINALLSPEQQKQYAELEKQMQAEFKQRMQERRKADAG